MSAYEKENAKEWQMDNGDQTVQVTEESDDEDDTPTTGVHESYTRQPVDDSPAAPPSHPSRIAGNNVIRTPTGTRTAALFKRALHGATNSRARTLPRKTVSQATPEQRHRVRGSAAIIPYERDNAAKAAWRRRKPNDGSFPLPVEYIEIARNHFAKDKDGAQKLVKNPYEPLEEIGVRTGSYVYPPRSVRDRILFIWGAPFELNKAKAALRVFITRSRRTVASTITDKGMPSVHPITQRQKNQQKRLMEEATRKQRYRQEPEEGRSFISTGMYLWSLEEVRPQEILGPSCEAFDPIRMYYGCYITFDQQLSVFKIMCDTESLPYTMKPVQGAIGQIGITICEYAARSSHPLHRYLVDPPSLELCRSDVKILRVPQPGGTNTEELIKIPTLVGDKPMPQELASWDEKRLRLARENKREMQRTTLSCIKRMRFYRGRLRMRVLLGVLGLKKFYWTPQEAQTIPVEEFVRNMRMSGTNGFLYKNLSGVQGDDDLLERTCQAIHLFEPSNIMTTNLKDVVPTYVAFFEFDDANSGSVRLEVGMGDVSGQSETYEATHRQWTRLDNLKVVRHPDGTVDENHPLELHTIRLQGGVTWKLQLAADNNVDPSRITPDMVDFADGVRCTVGSTMNASSMQPGQKVITFPQSFSLRRFEQKTAWKYRLKSHGSYNFELARYETFDPRLGAAKAGDTKPASTDWAATMYDTNWDHELNTNGRLEIGKAADWDPTLDTFFPTDYHSNSSGPTGGFHDFLQHVQTVVEFLNEAKTE